MKYALLGLCTALLPLFTANASEVKIVVSGDEFMGVPALELLMGNTVISENSLSSPASEEQTISISVPASFAQQPIGIRLSNDKYEANVGDRNLRLVKVNIGDTELSPEDFKYLKDGEELELNGDLYSSRILAVAYPPPEGWALNDSQLDCTTQIHVVDFQANDSSLNDNQVDALAPIIGRTGCAITLTGYSSTAGKVEINKAVARSRAQAVLQYLLAHGSEFTSTKIEAFGETTKFGRQQNANRRVVVQLHPAL